MTKSTELFFTIATILLSEYNTMSDDVGPDGELDVRGQNCPMPVVKTKQAVDDPDTGSVLEVVATVPGMDAAATRFVERKIGDSDDELVEGVTAGVGAASALSEMGEADVQLLV